MTPELWKKLRPLFFHAVELPPGAWKDFLARECGNDEALRLQLEKLLEAERRGSPLPEWCVLEVLDDGSRSRRKSTETWIGRYRVLKPIGAGGMGMVYKAVDPAGCVVALKMIGDHSDIRATFDTRKMARRDGPMNTSRRMNLIREARLAMRLKHPNVVDVLDYGQHHALLFIVMEFLDGQSLAQAMRGPRPLPLDRRLEIVMQVCTGVAFAHKRGVLHRDIKPDNIFIASDGTVKVLDFGIAAPLQSLPDRNLRMAGTFRYMAPELLQGSEFLNEKTDVWSIGVVLRELVQHACSAFADHSSFSGVEFSQSLQSVIARALALDQQARTPSPTVLAIELRALLSKLRREQQEANPSASNGLAALDALAYCAQSTLDTESTSQWVYTPIDVQVRRMRVREWKSRVTNYEPMIHTINSWQASFILLFIVSFAFHVNGRVLALPLLILSGSPYWLRALTIFSLTALEAFSGTPRCRSCQCYMSCQKSLTRFALTDRGVTFAFSDCLAALSEGLWEDATKLMSLHSLEDEPLIGNALVSPPFRFHLSFFECSQCRHSCATVTQEYREEERWIAQAKFSQAYRGSDGIAHKATSVRWALNAAKFFGRSLAVASRSMKMTSTHVVWTVACLFIMWLIWAGNNSAR